jgi:hypothetical protein
MQTEVVNSLLDWVEAVKENDLERAIARHDEVAQHIIENKNSAQIFSASGLDPEEFVKWNEYKKLLKKQLSKTPEQRKADFEEALEQVTEYAQRIVDAESMSDLLKNVSLLHDSLVNVSLNSSVLDEESEEDLTLPDE